MVMNKMGPLHVPFTMPFIRICLGRAHTIYPKRAIIDHWSLLFEWFVVFRLIFKPSGVVFTTAIAFHPKIAPGLDVRVTAT